mmetsp:Transcript_28798/g.62668  ORF Transcript_28798/g.62668 Transcript_28798/m.62668 type:complete len:277 (+) Transcript_28798:1822-2652(+)
MGISHLCCRGIVHLHNGLQVLVPSAACPERCRDIVEADDAGVNRDIFRAGCGLSAHRAGIGRRFALADCVVIVGLCCSAVQSRLRVEGLESTPMEAAVGELTIAGPLCANVADRGLHINISRVAIVEKVSQGRGAILVVVLWEHVRIPCSSFCREACPNCQTDWDDEETGSQRPPILQEEFVHELLNQHNRESTSREEGSFSIGSASEGVPGFAAMATDCFWWGMIPEGQNLVFDPFTVLQHSWQYTKEEEVGPHDTQAHEASELAERSEGGHQVG